MTLTTGVTVVPGTYLRRSAVSLFSIPAAYENDQIPDEFLDACYETASAQQRAWIKTTLALVQCVYHERPSREERTIRHAEKGFGATVRRSPAPWTLLVPGDRFDSAPRLAAALMVARLAGVTYLVAALPRSPSPSLAAALVLAGVEHVLTPTSDRLPELLEHLAGTVGRGRLLLFCADQERLRHRALEAGIPTWSEIRPPSIGILPPATPDRTVLGWAHPDSAITLAHEQAVRRHWDAVYATGPDTGGQQADLVLTPGLEGCWLYPDLSPDFFLNAEAAAVVLRHEDESAAHSPPES